MTRRLTMQQRIKQGLVAYWPLADLSAVDLKSRLYDARGPYDLTNNNTVTRAAGPSANLPSAASFASASSQYLSNANTRFMKPGQIMTVWAWVWPDGVTGAQEFIGEFGAAGNRSWLLRRNSAAPQLIATTDGTTSVTANAALATTAGAFTTQTWGLVIGEIVPGDYLTCQLYGVGSVHRVDYAGPGITSTNGLLIGASGDTPANFFNGRMGQVGIKIGLMSDSEKARVYNNGLGYDLVRGV